MNTKNNIFLFLNIILLTSCSFSSGPDQENPNFSGSNNISKNYNWVNKNGDKIPTSENIDSIGNLGVNLILTSDEKSFRNTWNNSKETPKLTTINEIKRNSSISAMLIFSGCEPNEKNICDLKVKFSLENPDGSLNSLGEEYPVWDSTPPKSKIMFLGKASPNISFSKEDSLGKYKIIADIEDKVSKSKLTVKSSFNVVE